MQKNRALSVDQQWLQELQFLMHLINLLSILHRCNGFTGIQKAAVDQIGRRLPNSDHDHFWVQVQHWEVLWSFFAFQPHWTGHLQLSCTTHFSLHITSWSRNGSQLLSRIEEDDISKHDFSFPIQLMRHLWGFHLSSLLQMLNDPKMVYIEFFSNFSYSCKRISFDDSSQLVTVKFWWLTTALLIFKALFPLQNFLNQHTVFESYMICLLAVSGPNVLLMLGAVVAALQPILNLSK